MVSVIASHQLPANLEALAERIVQALQQEAQRFTGTGEGKQLELAAVQFTCTSDPSNQQPGYDGIWRNARNDRCGSLNINSDGSFYAEYDLFCPHPQNTRWFVEMITVWGREESLRCEAKLIPSFEEWRDE